LKCNINIAVSFNLRRSWQPGNDSFALWRVCSSAVGAGFYGNEEANKGLQHFIEAAEDVRETILRTQSQVGLL